MQVTEIRKDGPAAKAGLRMDDVIVGIARWETTSAESVVFARNQPSYGTVFVAPRRPHDACQTAAWALSSEAV